MTAILGISSYYHDSAAAIVVDGEIVAAAQEERFTRCKNDHQFPKQAVEYCLEESGLAPECLDYVGFYEKPIRKFERLLETYLTFAPAGYRSFREAMPRWLKQKLHLPREIRKGLEGRYSGRFVFLDHHESHAASAFFPSPFEEAAILTLDGVGEWSTTCIGVGRGNKIELIDEIRFPHSLGLLYSAFTYYAGFRVNGGEYKVMGLAPYGQPVYRDRILRHLIDLKEDGSFRLDMRYFNYCQGLTMTSKRFHQLFGGPPRTPDSEITRRVMDVAASIQAVTEEIMLRMSRHIYARTGMRNLVMAGGVSLNCVGNGRILREGPFDRLWIQPAAGDAGGALGTALFIWHQLMEKNRLPRPADAQRGSLLGPAFSDESIAELLTKRGAIYKTCDSDEQLCQTTSQWIIDQKVIGWFQGRMEFGPRALGGRSILGDPRSPKMQSLINSKIKFRESFRPFAPIVLPEYVDTYFKVKPGEESPYMLLVALIQETMRMPLEEDDHWEDRGGTTHRYRSAIPAVTHVDDSARIQTVDQDRNPLFHQLLKEFHRQTGCPVLINTSFNIRDEPIVCTPDDAYRCFMMTDMDRLVIGRHILRKEEQPEWVPEDDRGGHLSGLTRDGDLLS